MSSSFVSLGAVIFSFCLLFLFLSCFLYHFCIDCARSNGFDVLRGTASRSFAAVFVLFACWPLHLLRGLLISFIYDRYFQASCMVFFFILSPALFLRQCALELRNAVYSLHALFGKERMVGVFSAK